MTIYVWQFVHQLADSSNSGYCWRVVCGWGKSCIFRRNWRADIPQVIILPYLFGVLVLMNLLKLELQTIRLWMCSAFWGHFCYIEVLTYVFAEAGNGSLRSQFLEIIPRNFCSLCCVFIGSNLVAVSPNQVLAAQACRPVVNTSKYCGENKWPWADFQGQTSLCATCFICVSFDSFNLFNSFVDSLLYL